MLVLNEINLRWLFVETHIDGKFLKRFIYPPFFRVFFSCLNLTIYVHT